MCVHNNADTNNNKQYILHTYVYVHADMHRYVCMCAHNDADTNVHVNNIMHMYVHTCVPMWFQNNIHHHTIYVHQLVGEE